MKHTIIPSLYHFSISHITFPCHHLPYNYNSTMTNLIYHYIISVFYKYILKYYFGYSVLPSYVQTVKPYNEI